MIDDWLESSVLSDIITKPVKSAKTSATLVTITIDEVMTKIGIYSFGLKFVC